MSRQSRAGPPPSAPSTGGATGGGATGGSGIPGPVVQQAQQYLEENIKRWMEPAPQPANREEILPLPLENPTAPQEQQLPGHPRLPSTSSSSSNPSRQHVLTRAQQALISPSSGYSEHSDRDPFSGLSDEERAICERAWRQASEAEKVLKQREEAVWRQFPHSLSFGGCSQHSLLQGTSYSTPCGNSPFGITQPSAAASFFARASQRLNLSAKRKKKNPEQSRFRTNFREIIKNHPPPVPPGLLRVTGRKEVTGVGKVKVMLRMCPSNEADSSYISVDSRKKQVTLYDPTVCGQDTSGDRHAGVAAPKMFAFDAVFSPDDNQAEVCSSSLCDVISTVVGGSDGCLFVYGHSKLGKTSTMIGNSNSAQEIGVIPSAIWWLFRAINEHKHRTGARFSVRVSAVELSGKAEELRDLLADYAAAGTEGSGAAPGAYLRDDQTIFGSYLTHQSELRAPTAERAAFLLDAALAARTAENEEDAKNSHFLFTLHVYQYRIEKGERGGVSGGRSRLHLFDLGSCEKTTKSRDGSSGGCLSLSALGNVILALFNGQKHVPYKDSKLTQLLREAMGSVMCRAAMIAHVSTNPSRYPETLATLQLASRIHRLRRKKLKFATSTELGPVGDDKGVCRPFVKIHAVGEDGVVKSGGSDQDYTSSSEQSCDTVIFVGSGRGTPLPSNICDRKPTQPMSPLAKETQIGTSGATGGTPKKQTSKGHHADKSCAAVGTASSGVQSTNKEQKSSEYISKSALNEQMRNSLSPKKKLSNSSPYSSPKHPKLGDGEGAKMSPKMSKYVMMDYGDGKKCKTSGESSAKGSPARMSKATDVHTKPLPLSATSSPQSQRKSKRSHKQDVTQQLLYQQQQAENALKLLMKEPKPSSDETWIDGPRFTKPKFDSRTLHQLQKEKWVDGPGMYGYMDVQKEIMIRKWVEDHSRIIPDADIQNRKEVWIDFPPGKDEKGSSHGAKAIPSTSGMEKHGSPPVVEKLKKEHRGKSSDTLPRESSAEQDKHHAKPPKESPKHAFESPKESKEKDQKVKPSCQVPMVSDLDNSINGNLSELLGHSDNGSMQSSSGSVDFNDNNSEDYGKEFQTLTESNRCLSNSNLQLEDKDGCLLLTDNNSQGDLVMMTDCSIQVTEEDIFTTCGWPKDVIVDNHHFSDTDSYEGVEHPLHVLSAEDLNLASSFTDSRAMSVDFDSLSVPEGWTADSHEMDPDLTWRLLKGGSLPHHSSRSSHARNLNSSDNLASKNNLLASKLEKLANLRQMIEKTSYNNQESWKPPLNAEGLKSFCTSDNRFPFISKLHHSADSSLEELRENDVNSIRSEPAELDIENFEFQFNVKPMNGLRLEAFYNKIQKVPLFPDCFSQFGKPTQVVPPIIKQQNKSAKASSEEESLKNIMGSQTSEKEIPERSPSKLKHRWSTSSSKRSTPTKDLVKDQPTDKTSDTSKLQTPESLPVFEKCSPNTSHDSVQTKAEIHPVPGDKKHSLSEIIQEQRCRVYSEGPSSSPVQFHSPKYIAQRTSKSRFSSEHSNHGNHGSKQPEVSEQRHDYVLVKQHQRKKGSPKFIPRGFLGSYRSSQKQKQHVQCSYPSVAGANLTDTLTVLSPGSSMTSTHISSPQVLTEAPSHGQKSQILIRSTSTPVSPFSNISSEAVLGGETYTYLSPAPKKESKWAARQSSSGHGSDSSVISADIKETKELLGKVGKTPQFSGTSSGYESMPRDSEGTPLSSSSQESGSEVGAKKESRGRKGTRKKTQGSSKRSRSVPARPPVTNSPTSHHHNQQQQQQNQQQPMPVSRQQLRGRLVRDLHDPTLWKSEEDVCCTSLLCCRLLDFY